MKPYFVRGKRNRLQCSGDTGACGFVERRSRKRFFRHRREHELPLSLTETEGVEVFSKVFGKPSDASIHRMLRKIAFNALATTALAALLKDAEESDFSDIDKNMSSEFEAMDRELDESAELFPNQGERSIARILEMTIRRLEDDRQADFDRLLVFPTGLSITPKLFAMFHSSSERRARIRLDFLERRCILERRGKGKGKISNWPQSDETWRRDVGGRGNDKYRARNGKLVLVWRRSEGEAGFCLSKKEFVSGALLAPSNLMNKAA